MITQTSLCTDCAEQVRNPICSICFSGHVIHWAHDNEFSKREMKRIRYGLRELIIQSEETPSRINCIICSSEKASLCAHCFMRRASLIIKRSVREVKLKEKHLTLPLSLFTKKY